MRMLIEIKHIKLIENKAIHKCVYLYKYSHTQIRINDFIFLVELNKI